MKKKKFIEEKTTKSFDDAKNRQSHSPHALEITPMKQKQRKPCREYQGGTGQIPSECQVRELSQL